MKIRKIVYTIGYIHILTFRENYKPIFAPYFDYQGLEYAIDNENTLHETIKLVYKSSGIILQFNKELAILVYEGDAAEVKKQNPVVEIFFDIIEKIKKINGFTRIANHRIELDFVNILETADVNNFLTANGYVYNPFNKLDEIAIVFEFTKDDKQYRMQFGNFNEKDIAKFNLSPLQTDYNKDLKGNVGLMCQITFVENTANPSFSKFKSLINEAEETFCNYLNKKNG